jgi:hypothetical protein
MKYALLKVLFAIGFGATLIGGFEVWLLVQGTAEPQSVTLEELGKADGTRNVHLSITKFAVGPNVYCETKNDGKWGRVWIPLMAPGGKWTPRKVVAWSNAVSNETELKKLLNRPTLPGVVTNGMQSLGSNQREALAMSYPGVDFNGALAFQIDRSFPSPWIAYPVAGVGVALLTLCGCIMFGLFRKPADPFAEEEPRTQ